MASPSAFEPLLREVGPFGPTVASFTQRVLLDANFQPEGLRIARSGDTPTGMALAIARQVPLENAPPDFDRGYITLLSVLPEHRRKGIGSALLEEAEMYLRGRGCTSVWVSPYAPGYFLPGLDRAAHAAALALFERRGYRCAYEPLAMTCPLGSLETPKWVESREREWASRFRIVPFSTELAVPLLEFVKRVFPGDWVRVVREAASRILEGDAATRLYSAQTVQGEVVGFSHHLGNRFGPIGTEPKLRGLGLGQALMFRTLHAQREQGHAQAYFLWSDDRTARRLYDAAGFVEAHRFAVMTREL